MQRLYYLDALRVLAVLLLIPFHVGLIYAPFFVFVIPGQERSPLIGAFIVAFLHIWHMPLFFLISGAAARLSLLRRTASGYLAERVTRLFIPLMAGMAVAVAPQMYFERRWWEGYTGSFLDYYPRFWTTGFYPHGDLTWQHLWFLVYLFTISLLTMPLLIWLRSDRGQRVLARVVAPLIQPGGIFLLIVPTLITEWIFRARWPGYQNLVADWANLTLYLLMFLSGYLIFSDRRVMDAIVRYRRLALLMALPLTAVIVGDVYLTARRPMFTTRDPVYYIYTAAVVVAMWGWVLAALGYAAHHWNRDTPLLRYATSIAFPFYIVHQAWIVLLAYYIVPLGWPIAAQFTLIASATLLLTWPSAEAIKRLPLIRLLFGLKGRDV